MTFVLNFSCKNIDEKISKNTGPDDAIIGTLMLAVYGNARKKKVIFKVIPKIAAMIRVGKCSRLIRSLLYVNGNSKYAAMKKRKKARVNVPIFSKDHLKIGEAAPQMILAIISAMTAFWWLDRFMD